jgi:hypothetical protein
MKMASMVPLGMASWGSFEKIIWRIKKSRIINLDCLALFLYFQISTLPKANSKETIKPIAN